MENVRARINVDVLNLGLKWKTREESRWGRNVKVNLTERANFSLSTTT
jgi:hypothetical protein